MKINYFILIFSIFLGIVNKLFLYSVEFCSSYLADILTLPIILSLYSVLFDKQISLEYGIILTIVLSILTEFARPIINLAPSVFDWWDIVAYFVGLMIYYILICCDKNERGRMPKLWSN